MRMLDNLRIALGFFAMLLAVGWYGALYIGIDLPVLVSEKLPILGGLSDQIKGEPGLEESSAGAASPDENIGRTIFTHVIPGILILAAMLTMFGSRKRTN